MTAGHSTPCYTCGSVLALDTHVVAEILGSCPFPHDDGEDQHGSCCEETRAVKRPESGALHGTYQGHGWYGNTGPPKRFFTNQPASNSAKIGISWIDPSSRWSSKHVYATSRTNSKLDSKSCSVRTGRSRSGKQTNSRSSDCMIIGPRVAQ